MEKSTAEENRTENIAAEDSIAEQSRVACRGEYREREYSKGEDNEGEYSKSVQRSSQRGGYSGGRHSR